MGYSGQNAHAMCHTTPCVLPAIRPIYPTNRAIFDEMPRLEKVTSNVPHSCKPRCLLFWQYAWAHTSSDTDNVSEEYRLDAATLMEHFLL